MEIRGLASRMAQWTGAVGIALIRDPRPHCAAMISTRDLSHYVGQVHRGLAWRRCRKLACIGDLCRTHAEIAKDRPVAKWVAPDDTTP